MMKKVIAIVLALVTVLSLCACGAESEKNPEGLQVGYARESIMPEGVVGMAGYSDDGTRKSNGYLDIVYTTCIAFTEGEETVLVYTEDLLGKSITVTAMAREEITKATGIPGDRIVFANTHNHSGPSLAGSAFGKETYRPLYFAAIVKAAQNALADRASAEIYGAKTKTEGLNFIRHYLQEDGTYTSRNNGNLDLKTVKGHAREADEEMVLLKLDRLDDSKKDIVMLNWAAHPCTNDNYNTISADYIGAVRTAFEEQTGLQLAFFQGAGGDVGADSSIPELRHDLERVEYGAAIAQYAIDALPNMTKIEGSGVKITQKKLAYPSNKYGQDRLKEAELVLSLPNADRTVANAHGFVSISECRGIVSGASREEMVDMELDAITVGGVAFATASWEMFSATGKYIKEQSPYEYTMVFSCANGKESYIPIAEAYDYPCYELFVAKYEKGTAEKAADELIGMLKDFQ